LDGTDVAALRRARFHRGSETINSDARAISVEERQLYLTRYMQQASQHKQNKRAQHSRQPQAVQPTAAPTAVDPTVGSVTSPPPPTPPPISAYPLFSTLAVAEALLAESSASLSSAVPLSSLPAVILSHCSASESLLSASSSAVLRLQSMCSEPSAALLGRAFADLHSRGCVVTAGQLYGGDLLLYADDPSSCHAHSIVSVRSSGHSRTGGAVISALDLLTVARIASGVSKGVVLAYEAAERGEVAYLTLHWQPSLSAVP